jgi:hypothetical protein
LERAEADLGRALLITVDGVRLVVSAQQVLDEVARKFDVNPSSMEIMKAAPEDFLLLSDLRAADRVFNRGLPLCGSGFTLFFKRWTRLALASGAILPSTVEVELRGVPAHAWEKTVAQQLLSYPKNGKITPRLLVWV